jgi:hypothetical protein
MYIFSAVKHKSLLPSYGLKAFIRCHYANTYLKFVSFYFPKDYKNNVKK